MAYSTVDTSITGLVLNKIPSMENFKYMQENNLINENELYFIIEKVLYSPEAGWLWKNEFIDRNGFGEFEIAFVGPVVTFESYTDYKIRLIKDKIQMLEFVVNSEDHSDGNFSNTTYENFTISFHNIGTNYAVIFSDTTQAYNFTTGNYECYIYKV